MKRILLAEPQKSKKYHTQYPPLALLKIATYHKNLGDKVKLVKGYEEDFFDPHIIYITSLFTYAWQPVHDIIKFYRHKYPKAEIIVGGIYATLCYDHLYDAFKDQIIIHRGTWDEIDDLLPDYTLTPRWDASIIFSSRGCIRNCSFCYVKKLEPKFYFKKSIKHLVFPSHKRIIFWDNNFLASPFKDKIFEELFELNKQVDFNQGLDARLINYDIALKLKQLKIPEIRLAYDTIDVRQQLKKAIEILKEVGFRGKQIIVFCLFNNPYSFDTPETFLYRLQDLAEWGVVSYPMRFQALTPQPKNSFVSPFWTFEKLEMVERARRIFGNHGAFPPHDGIKKKFLSAKSFEEAMTP